LKREYNATRFSASADKHYGQTEKKVRVRDLPNAPLTTENVLAARTAMEKAFASMQEQSQRGELPPIPADSLPVILDWLVGFLGRATEIGIQAALLERLPVARFTKEGLLKLKTDELVGNYAFEFCVRTFAREVLGANETDQDFLARTVSIADCPGSWLRRRLEPCVRRACHEPKPNHQFDAERLAYLPYVDLLLTDKQMAEFVRQIMRDKSAPARIRNARPAVSTPNSIDALEEVLDSLCIRTSEAAAST
jgi:hypothetical protein